VTAPLLVVDDVHVELGGRRVLAGLSLALDPGETVCLLGPSGGGKTVLLRAILGLRRPDRGRILFDGVDLASAPEKRLVQARRRIGMVFQGAALFDSMTVGENVAYGLRHGRAQLDDAAIDRRVAESLELVALPGIEPRAPAELSGGMKKRVAIARAIAPGPDLLLYDEPTGGLDPATARRIAELIAWLDHRLGVTSLVVTHDLDLARRAADRIALLEDGRVGWHGPPDDLASPPPPLARFLNGENGWSAPVGSR
jgi:phospholipid/cholesterol/gamma-HCH transport system ATP-binding protein